MKLNKRIDVNDLYRFILNSDKSMELKRSKKRCIDNIEVYMASFEKRILRNGQIATCSILVTIYDDETTCDIITSSGGKTLFDTSDHINKSFFEKMLELLSSYSFNIEEGIDEYYPS